MLLDALISPGRMGSTIVDDSGMRASGWLERRAAAVALELRDCGVRPGEVVALLADNGAEFVASVLGIVTAGAVAALVDPALPPGVIKRIVQGAAVGTLCWWGRGAAQRIWQIPHLASLIQVIELRPEESARHSADMESMVKPPRADHAPCLVIYSSGTTGEPKGVVLSHRAVASNVQAIAEYIEPNSKETFLIAKSMVHSSTMIGEVLVALARAAQVIALNPLVTPRQILRRIQEHRATFVGLNPALLRLLLASAADAGQLSSVRTVHVSGSIIEPEVLTVFRQRFPSIRVINGYGLTEAGPRVTYTRSATDHKPATVGRPVSGVAVEVVGTDGSSCGVGEIGEVLVSSPSVCEGYLIEGRVQPAHVEHGWLRTGDLGYRDVDGDLFITGRCDELILTSSHKVNPADIEEIIKKVTGITDCLVFGMADRLLGQRVICAYTRDAVAGPSITALEAQIRAICTDSLASFQIPKTMVCWDVLPTGAGGKKSRRLAQQLLARQGSA